MNKIHAVITSFLFTILTAPLIAQVSIAEIQYTSDAGEGTYPSPYLNQVVTTGGIVSGIDYNDGRFFLSSSQGGAWNGIYVYDNTHSPAIGDSVIIEAQVYEYYGFTELKNINSYITVSNNNPLPDPAIISSAELSSDEAYESVLVQVMDAAVTTSYDTWNEWRINDGSGEAIVSNGIMDLANMGAPLPMTYPFEYLSGIVSYSWGEYRLHPRSLADLQSSDGAFILSLGSTTILDNTETPIDLDLSFFGEHPEITTINITLQYDPAVAAFSGYNTVGTLSDGATVNEVSGNGVLNMNINGPIEPAGSNTLINLLFQGNDQGYTDLDLHSAQVNGGDVPYRLDGSISVLMETEPIGDTLTVVMRPLINIPSIHVPGERLEVTCLASPETGNWEAHLEHGDYTLELNLHSSTYDHELNRWHLEFDLPYPEFYELFDLHIRADAVDDVSRQSVQLMSERKQDWEFIHITDTHLATHYYYEDPQSLGDSSEMVDLRAVIEDINLIHPEFVLITGDLINEGELESFEGRRNFTKAKRLLREIEVPVYLVSGNHDIGGWDATPPPDGTARYNWWKFFGWPWLDQPSGSALPYTQDYSFDYGPLHFIGMESYINYDDFRWNIYGNTSFIPSQLEWLQSDLQSASQSQTKVIFYHMDFADQIDLGDLGLDMALWGHIHSNSGSIHSHPFDLATGSVCDDNRRYRVIRVSGAELQPEETVYADWPQDHLTAQYSNDNSGETDSVTVQIINHLSMDFPNGRIKVKMPRGDHGFQVTHATLQQAVWHEDHVQCYVGIDIQANSSIEFTIRVDTTQTNVEDALPGEWLLHQNYPNPFNPNTTIRFELPGEARVTVEVFDLKGRMVQEIANQVFPAGDHKLTWDGRTSLQAEAHSGIYILRMQSDQIIQEQKMLLLR